MMLSACLPLLLAGTAAPAPEEPPLWTVPATPQRPTLTENARTTAPGYLELEAGLAADADRFDSPMTFKLGLDARTEVSLGLSPLLHRETPQGSDSGFGDLFLGGKHRFFEGPDFDAAGMAFVKLPTAEDDQGLGTGDTDVGLDLVLSSKADERDRFDLLLGLSLVDVELLGSDETSWRTAAVWTRDLDARTSFFGELAAVVDDVQEGDVVQTTWGGRFLVNRSFVLDVAVSVGLSDDAPDLRLMIGGTKVLGRVFEEL